MKTSLYPLKFNPILKEKIWGGEKLKKHFGKSSHSNQVGESWEISTVPKDVSIVSNGPLKGKTLQTLVDNYGSQLLGDKNFKRFGKDFPLLIKFIDAKEDLSIQLHPDDELAKKRHNTFGKTEMWYVMQADEDANLIVGFNQNMTQEKYLSHLKNKTLTEILNFEKVEEGDTFFIESGRVHAIGAGVLLAEIQQTSDVTYRVYDWDRVDADGNERELHNHIAIDAFNFEMKNDYKVAYKTQTNSSNRLVSCPFFTTNFIEVNSTIIKDNLFDSFIIYMCVDGKVDVLTETITETINKGETILIPASLDQFKLKSDYGKLLEVYV
ncbi:MAG: class I mannose-6-phosphate isomerase [Winogradskyella sp.]|uniref:type I phosphomannose isomerase catalytic subunit n=1 Tax=Winogradskyella sp. TaxID=1883156 RepID=UPI00182E8C2C|nr:class I mannose-6-phosphate isomerase [Winogradskyella sp.]